MRKPFISFILAVILIVPSWGCKHPSATAPSSTTESVILIGTTSATLVGLTALSMQNSDLAHLVAGQLKTICDTGALPYLNGTGGAVNAISSATINTFLSGQFSGMPAEVQSFVTVAAGALDEFLPAPSATTYLSTAQLAYVKDFFTGLSNGCASFLGGRSAVAAKGAHRSVGGSWFNLTKNP